MSINSSISSSSSLSMVEAKLPPGFRFHPRDEELICDYLMMKINGSDHPHNQRPPFLIQVDLNKVEPWDIPKWEWMWPGKVTIHEQVIACVGGKEWYFYSQRDRKYATGSRTNRATVSGYWKATGKDRAVMSKGSLVGMRKTLVFYQGRAPKGRKTEWVMHEFRLEGPLAPPQLSSLKEDWVLCRVFHKNREIPNAKQGIASDIISIHNTSFYDHHHHHNINDTSLTSSSSLPLLTDPYNITINQTHPNNNASTTPINDYYYEQVPCFSIFSAPNHHIAAAATTGPSAIHHHHSTAAFGSLPADVYAYLNATSSSSSVDKNVIKAVLDHLNNVNSNINNYNSNNNNMSSLVNLKGGGSPSFGEGSSESTSFLSEVGLTTMWNNNNTNSNNKNNNTF